MAIYSFLLLGVPDPISGNIIVLGGSSKKPYAAGALSGLRAPPIDTARGPRAAATPRINRQNTALLILSDARCISGARCIATDAANRVARMRVGFRVRCPGDGEK